MTGSWPSETLPSNLSFALAMSLSKVSSDEYSPTIRPPTSSCRAILTVCATDGSHSTTSNLQWLDRPDEKIFHLFRYDSNQSSQIGAYLQILS